MASNLSAVAKFLPESTEYHSFQAVKRQRLSRLMGEQPTKTELFIEYLDLLRDIDRVQPSGTYDIYRVSVAPSGVPGRRKRIARYVKYERSF